MMQSLKPRSFPYIWLGTIINLVSIAIFSAFSFVFVANIFPNFMSIWLGVIGAVTILNIVSIGFRFVSYKKEVYELYKDKIVRRSGGLFSDYSTELLIKNITQVELVLPFWEYLIFKTGYISIDSSGSSIARVQLSNLENPQQVYEQIQELMRVNEFSLNMDKVIQEERPRLAGLIIETLNAVLGLGAFFLFSLSYFPVVGVLAEYVSASNLLVFGIAAFLFGGILVAIALVIRFFDLKQRIYTVYNDTITYNEGFLTKHQAFIAVENLADSSTKQSFLQKLFGIYEIKISASGTAADITFKNMGNGAELEDNIDKIIAENNLRSSKSKPTSSKSEVVNLAKTVEAETVETVEANVEEPVVGETITLKMDFARHAFSLIPAFISLAFSLVFLLIFPVVSFIGGILVFSWIFSAGLSLIKVFVTDYQISSQSVKETYNFLSTKNLEFSRDKITGVSIKQDLWDRLLGTYTITFLSIGSSENLNFSHIRPSGEVFSRVKSLLRIDDNSSSVEETHRPEFNLPNYLFSNLIGLSSAGTLLAVLVILGIAIDSNIFRVLMGVAVVAVIVLFALNYFYQYFYQKTSRLEFYNSFLKLDRGLINREEIFILYKWLKATNATKFPASAKGHLQIQIAGETAVATSNSSQYANGKTFMTTSNSFDFRFAPNVITLAEKIDQVSDIRKYVVALAVTKDKASNVLLEAKPKLINDVISYGWISLFIFPIPFVIYGLLSTANTSYVLQEKRVVRLSGIIFKTRLAINYRNIDSIDTAKGFLNNSLGNGSVLISVLGSSTPALTLNNIVEYKAALEVLQAKINS